MISSFISIERVKTKMLKFDELTGETALQITKYILNILTKWSKKKLYYSVFC